MSERQGTGVRFPAPPLLLATNEGTFTMKRLIYNYLDWRKSGPRYRAVMTDIGRSFLMRDLRLRRVPGMIRVQQQYRARRPLQPPDAYRWTIDMERECWADILAEGD